MLLYNFALFLACDGLLLLHQTAIQCLLVCSLLVFVLLPLLVLCLVVVAVVVEVVAVVLLSLLLFLLSCKERVKNPHTSNAREWEQWVATVIREVVSTPTGVCEKNTPFTGASAMLSCSRNSSPSPDLVL